jgi:hypothetical protein
MDFEKYLKGRDLYTAKDLVKLGFYGGKSSVHAAWHSGDIEGFYISDRRLVFTKESIIKHLQERNKCPAHATSAIRCLPVISNTTKLLEKF